MALNESKDLLDIILDLYTTSSPTFAEVGHKSLSLIRMTQYQLPVPPGFILTARSRVILISSSSQCYLDWAFAPITYLQGQSHQLGSDRLIGNSRLRLPASLV
jgi:hypothetical protein